MRQRLGIEPFVFFRCLIEFALGFRIRNNHTFPPKKRYSMVGIVHKEC